VVDSCVILDFDDTLFPTSHIASCCPKLWRALHLEFFRPDSAPSLRPRRGSGIDRDAIEHIDASMDENAFAEFARTAAAALHLAASLGRVCVITMAQKGWVEACCRMLMPEVWEVLEELRIPIVYAREAVPQSHLQRALQEGLAIDQLCKERALKSVLRRMSTANRRSAFGQGATWWRSLLSVGDGDGERLALQDVLMAGGGKSCRGCLKSCHCKTVKLIESPQLETLRAQLQILVAWLPRLSTHDGDMDISFDRLAAEGHEMGEDIGMISVRDLR
jgi:hypothetical protein